MAMSYMRVVLGMLKGLCDRTYIYLVSIEPFKIQIDMLQLQYYIGPNNSSKLYKFTSPADFAPHAKWIYDDQTRSACFCRICGGKRCQALRRLSPPIDVIKSRSPSPSASSITSTETFRGDVPPKSYREGEVVWVSLTPQAEHKPLEESVPFWPAVVADVEVELGREKGRHVVGFNVYIVHLLGTTVTERAYDVDVIPYLGYRPSIELNVLAAKYEALPPSAIQALIDRWKNSAESVGLKRIDGRGPRRPITLESITPWYLAAVHACENIALCYSVDYPYRLQSEGSHKDQANQYYQGIWWGCERIWTFDLVRLKAERCQFPDEAQACFLPVSESSPTMRGLFLYINAIYEPKEDPRRAIPSLTGMLYEITAIAQDNNAGGASESTAKVADTGDTGDTGETSLPPAPAHFSWKQVLDSNDCVTIPASLIAGRYYPEIHLHPRLGSSPVPETSRGGIDLGRAEVPSRFPAILSLAGLERGWQCQTKSNRRTKVRHNAMQQASAAENRAQEWINDLLQRSNLVL